MPIENIFERVCRRLLREETLDLGKIEFSPQRTDGVPKDEPNTDLEEEILAHLGRAVDGGGSIPEDISSSLVKLMKSKKYGSFFHEPDTELVYRGIGRLPREKVAKWLGVDPIDLEDSGESDVDFVMQPIQGSTHNSWTKDPDIGEKFSRRGSRFDDPQGWTGDYGYSPGEEVLKLKREYEEATQAWVDLQPEVARLQREEQGSPEYWDVLKRYSALRDNSSKISGQLYRAKEEDVKAWKKSQKKQKKKTVSAYLDVVITANVPDNPGKFLDLHDIMERIKFDQFKGYKIQKEVISLAPVKVSSISWKPASKKRISAPWKG